MSFDTQNRRPTVDKPEPDDTPVSARISPNRHGQGGYVVTLINARGFDLPKTHQFANVTDASVFVKRTLPHTPA